MAESNAHRNAPLTPQDRASLIDVLTYHWRRSDSGCGCGWHDLGRSWPEHIVTVFEESVMVRG